MQTTADVEQVHSFWMTIWNYLTRFIGVLNLKEVQDALTSVNEPEAHPFWGKFKEALWTLVSIPQSKEEELVRFRTREDIAAISTREWLKRTKIEITPGLKKRFVNHQLCTFSGTNYVRLVYDSHDLQVLGNITRLFPRLAVTPFGHPFGWKKGEEMHVQPYPLPCIEQLIDEVDASPPGPRAIQDPHSENLFFVHGVNGPLMVSVRRHLNTWSMRPVEVGDGFRGPNVYVFI